MAEEPHLPEEGEIERKAIELFQKDWRRTHPREERAPTPEYTELKEGGWLALARSEIMSGHRGDLEAYRSYLEGELEKIREDLGIKPPPELEDLEKKLDSLEAQLGRNKEALKRAKEREAELEEEIRRLKAPPTFPPITPPKPLVPVEKGLGKVEEDGLRDHFTTGLRTRGVAPDRFMAEFRIELEEVIKPTYRNLPREEAYRKASDDINRLVNAIAERERPPTPPIARPPITPPPALVEVPMPPMPTLPAPMMEYESPWMNLERWLREIKNLTLNDLIGLPEEERKGLEREYLEWVKKFVEEWKAKAWRFPRGYRFYLPL